MKRFILAILIAMFMSFGAMAGERKITSDVYDNGIQMVEAKGCIPRSFTDTKVLTISLQRWTTESDTTYIIKTVVTSNNSVHNYNGATLKMKLTDGEIIELNKIKSSSHDETLQLGSPTVTGTVVGNTVIARYHSNRYNIGVGECYWIITPEQIMKLGNGVVRLKITDQYDKEWNKDKIGSVMVESYEALRKYDKQPVIDDF